MGQLKKAIAKRKIQMEGKGEEEEDWYSGDEDPPVVPSRSGRVAPSL